MRRPIIVAMLCSLGCGAPQPEPGRVDAPAFEAAPEPAVPEPTPPPRFDIPPPPAPSRHVSYPLAGFVLAHGGGPLRADVIKRFCNVCGRYGKLVLIPTAAEGADNPSTLEKLPKRWLDRVGRVDVLHTLDPGRANESEFLAPLRDADCVWFGGGAQGRLRDAYVDTKLTLALHAVLLRGGIVGGYSAGAAILPDVIIRRGNPDPVEDVGFGVLPGVIVDQHFLAKEREPRMLTMLSRHPERIGYGIDEDAAILVHGATYEVIGNGVVRRCEHGTGCTSLEAGAKGSFP